jgi:hypothetical protein
MNCPFKASRFSGGESNRPWLWHGLSRLQRRILAWLAPEEQRIWGMMAASHEDLVHDKSNLSHSLANKET